MQNTEYRIWIQKIHIFDSWLLLFCFGDLGQAGRLSRPQFLVGAKGEVVVMFCSQEGSCSLQQLITHFK